MHPRSAAAECRARPPVSGRPDPRPRAAERPKRTDIQGLRAVAVTLVLAFHLWPDLLSGGYVGVDVFFVISGFLITSHLVKSPPRRLGDLATFWSRRIARLVPAALVVLVATLAASRAVGPETQWADTGADVRAAGLYVVNWRFADQAVDYLASDDLPSPVQHFWSLSVEEQFYAGWPLLLMALFGLVALDRAGRGAHRLAVVAGLAAVTTASLAWSIHLTGTDPGRAYFVTPTRIWELGFGGVLATLVVLGRPAGVRGTRLHDRVRDVVAAGGLAAIAWSAWTYTGSTPFPGWHALVPVLGTVAVIAATPQGWLGRALALGPMQFLGGISYSLYLWHWPMIVLLPAATGRALSGTDRIAVLVVAVLVAAASKRYVEDPFLRPGIFHPVRVRFTAGATGMAVLVGLTAFQGLEVQHREDQARRALNLALSTGGPCFGAAALDDPGCARSVRTPVVPAIAQAAKDKSQAYAEISGGQDCFARAPEFASVRCDFGPADADVSIALVGNSHAGQWLPAVQALAAKHGWRITTLMASQCALSAVPQAFPTPAQSAACGRWVKRTTREVAAGRYSAVVLANRVSVPEVGRAYRDSAPGYQRGYNVVLKEWKRAGVPLLGIRDTPTPVMAGLDVPECLALHADNFAPCTGTRDTWLPPEPLVAAVNAMDTKRMRIIDLTDQLCGPVVCDPAVGGVVVYFDGSHLAATFAKTLAPYLEPALQRVLSV